MAKKQLHPSVQQFKEFVKSNPELIKTVRNGKRTWQELYEEWVIFGEDDSRWNQISEETEVAPVQKEKKEEPSEKKDWMTQMLGAMKNMDPNQMQSHIANLSSALGAIQGVIASLQGGSNTTNESTQQSVSPPSHPFQFRQD